MERGERREEPMSVAEAIRRVETDPFVKERMPTKIRIAGRIRIWRSRWGAKKEISSRGSDVSSV